MNYINYIKILPNGFIADVQCYRILKSYGNYKVSQNDTSNLKLMEILVEDISTLSKKQRLSSLLQNNDKLQFFEKSSMIIINSSHLSEEFIQSQLRKLKH